MSIEIIADSVADFSSTQGENDWYYGYYDEGFSRSGYTDPGSFQQMEYFYSFEVYDAWGAGAQWLLPVYTVLFPEGGHPNGINTTLGRASDEQWAVRRWISDVEGEVIISGNYNDINRGGGGDGAIVRIFNDGVEVFSGSVDHYSPAEGFDYSITIEVSIGSIIDFAIDPGLNSWDGDDSIRFTATIEADISAEPDPITGFLDGPGTVNLNNKGVTPFTLFGSDDIDVSDIDVDSLLFGDENSGIGVAQKKNGSFFASYEDVNEDGELDLVVKVETNAFEGMVPTETFEVFGSLNDGTEVVFGLNEGDSINFI